MMQKSIILVVILLIVGQCGDVPSPIVQAFAQYKVNFDKTYDTPEINDEHLNYYYENFKILETFITDDTNTYTLGETTFSDILKIDYQKNKLIKNVSPGENGGILFVDVDNLATDLDWREVESFYISGAKDQLDCSASWAVAVVDAVEAYNSILTGEVTEQLSVQQLLDCVNVNYNCDGGWPFDALRWVQHNGLTTEADYPYTGIKGECQKPTGTYFISTIRGLTSDIIQLKAAVALKPIVVCFDASELALYTEGSVNQNCKNDKPNYCGLLVGYDENNWFIKGSFGEQWGIQGYVTIKQGKCGVENYAFSILTSSSEDVPEEIVNGFEDYKTAFEKTYPERESDFLHQFYYNWYNDQKINDKNLGFQFGYTYFTDAYPEQFMKQYLLEEDFKIETNESRYYLKQEEILGDVDWRTEGIVGAVQFQGTSCKSQWAISVASALESYFRQQTSNKVALSAQQLIDCVIPNKQGCEGGVPSQAFDWIQDNGITSQLNYPYTGDAVDCKKQMGELKAKTIFKLGNTVDNLKQALSKRPVVVCFDASQLLDYKSGIITEAVCTPGVAPNHCGLAVGFDENAWIVRSSFGLQWGEAGYIRIKMGNTCGILDNAIYPQN